VLPGKSTDEVGAKNLTVPRQKVSFLFFVGFYYVYHNFTSFTELSTIYFFVPGIFPTITIESPLRSNQTSHEIHGFLRHSRPRRCHAPLSSQGHTVLSNEWEMAILMGFSWDFHGILMGFTLW
jgi:hypothetical protein